MTFRFKPLRWVVIVTLLGSTAAYSTGVPVYDAMNDLNHKLSYLRMGVEVAQMKSQLQQMTSLNGITGVMKQQIYDNFQRQYKQITGSYGMGNLYNDLKNQVWTPDSWMNAMSHMTGPLKNLADNYKTQFPTSEHKIDQHNPDGLQAKTYTALSNNAIKTLALSAAEYDRVNESAKRLHNLTGKIDQTQNIKASMDLNSRITAELGFIQLEQLKVQAAHTNLDAMKVQSDINTQTVNVQYLLGDQS